MKEKYFIILIAVLSVAIPGLVALLLYVPREGVGEGSAAALNFIPALNAGINTAVAILLVAGRYFIAKRRISLHRMIMLSAVGLSVIFLIGYLIYHYNAGEVKYRGEGLIRTFYLVILASHILLSIVIVPLVLLSVYRGIKGQVEKHKKIVKFAWPLWLYVAITGVVVYLMAHPFNPVV